MVWLQAKLTNLLIFNISFNWTIVSVEMIKCLKSQSQIKVVQECQWKMTLIHQTIIQGSSKVVKCRRKITYMKTIDTDTYIDGSHAVVV